ncbi:MAG: hypothetical protein WCO86_15805, partial [Planctomycetota bacterium]
MSINATRTARITPGQLKVFQENGSVVLREVFSEAEMNSLQRECDRLLVEEAELIDPDNVRCRFMPNH